MNNILDLFQDITGYDIRSYLEDFVDFSNNQQAAIDYYNGVIKNIDSSYFETLNRLKIQTIDIQNLFTINKGQFNTFNFWDLIELVDNIYVKLDTISNYPKWLRSSVVLSNFGDNISVDYVLKQNQTLESLANEIGYNDPDNDWKTLALNNDLEEVDYDDEGGNIFKFSWQNDLSFKLQTVVGIINKDNIYGKDFNKKIQFIDDDLLCLDTKSTLYQNVDILLNLLKGDNPEFPNDGVDKTMITKLNRNFNIYPSLFRQIYSTFSKDDTLKSISIIDINKNNDSVNMEFRIETRSDEIIKAQI